MTIIDRPGWVGGGDQVVLYRIGEGITPCNGWVFGTREIHDKSPHTVFGGIAAGNHCWGGWDNVIQAHWLKKVG